MTLILETGSIVPGANSYASVSQANLRHADSTSADRWDEFEPTQKEQRLVKATRLLDTYLEWTGFPYLPTQPLGFPRRSIYDRSGRIVHALAVPPAVRDATIDLALWLPDDVAVAATDEVIEEIDLGPIGIKMAVAQPGAAPSRPVIPPDIIMSLRGLGTYLGTSAGVGRLIR